jgi:hypothetical protein
MCNPWTRIIDVQPLAHMMVVSNEFPYFHIKCILTKARFRSLKKHRSHFKLFKVGVWNLLISFFIMTTLMGKCPKDLRS